MSFLGQLEVPSGNLIVIDAGLSVYWDVYDEDAVDLEIVGPDAEAAGKSFDRQWNPRFLYDIPDVSGMSKLFAEHCAGLKADLRELEARVPHGERALAVLPAGIAHYEGMWAVAVGGLPTDRVLEVHGELLEGEFADRWRRVWLDVCPGTPVVSTQVIEGYMVDHGQLLLCDLAAFEQFRGGRTQDGLADYVFWGKDAPALAEELGASRLDEREFGWVNLPDDEIGKYAALVEKRIGEGLLCGRDYRPHCRLEELNRQMRSSEQRVGIVEVDGSHAVGMDNRWGDGIFPIILEYGPSGELVRVVVDLGNEKRQQLMRDVQMLSKPCLVTRHVLDGQPIQFGERDEDGWFWSAGTETEKEMDTEGFVRAIPLGQVARMEPLVKKWLRAPAGTQLERDGDEFVESV